MSQSPVEALEAGASSGEVDDAYVPAWRAINRLMRRGHSWSGNERNVAFLNLGDGTFAEITRVSGFDEVRDGRALATFDQDLDGDVDLLTTNRDAWRAELFSSRPDVVDDTVRPDSVSGAAIKRPDTNWLDTLPGSSTVVARKGPVTLSGR